MDVNPNVPESKSASLVQVTSSHKMQASQRIQKSVGTPWLYLVGADPHICIAEIQAIHGLRSLYCLQNPM